ncbi:MAG: hypothetical protein IKZ58_05755 [Selenomonadaceae bacterium]|nr:hypothetical protein [Selenomonadaceae bacterium]
MLRPKRKPQGKLAYCQKCGKLFTSLHGENLCPPCNAEDRAAKEKIKDYMRENPKASLKEAADATGAPSGSVRRLTMEIMSAKLNANKNIDSVHPCANCGTMIKTGTYCPACAVELQKKAQQNAVEISSVSQPNTPKPAADTPTVKGLDEDFNKSLKEKPARRRMYQSVIEERRGK